MRKGFLTLAALAWLAAPLAAQEDYDAPDAGMEDIVAGGGAATDGGEAARPSAALNDVSTENLAAGRPVKVEIARLLEDGTRQGFTAGGATGGAVAAFTLTHAPADPKMRARGVILILVPSDGGKPTHLHLPLDPPPSGDSWDLAARIEEAEKAGKWPSRIPALSTLMVQILKKNGETSGAPMTVRWR